MFERRTLSIHEIFFLIFSISKNPALEESTTNFRVVDGDESFSLFYFNFGHKLSYGDRGIKNNGKI